MKRYLWVVALVLVASFAGTVAAESSHVQQDQAFLNELAQPAKAPAAMTPAATEVPLPFAPLSLCNQTFCTRASDCYAACGGPGSAYCEVVIHRCNFL